MKAKFKPGIMGFIVLACIALVCVDAVAGFTLMRIHEKAWTLKAVLSAFNIFGVFVVAGLYMREKCAPQAGKLA